MKVATGSHWTEKKENQLEFITLLISIMTLKLTTELVN